MRFFTIQPPDPDKYPVGDGEHISTELQEAIAVKANEITETAKRLGINLNAEEFIVAWLGGVRVIVGYADSGEIAHIAFASMGVKWHDERPSMTILASTNSPELIEHCASIASASGCKSLFYHNFVERVEPDGKIIREMVEAPLVR